MAAENIRVVVMQGEGALVAQCLEYDICAQGADWETVTDNLRITLNAEAKEGLARHGSPFAGIGPAPSHFYQLWDETDEVANEGPEVAGYDGQVCMKAAA